MKYFKKIIATAQHTKKQGFTFIETLVAITVLLIAVVAPMSLSQEGIVAAKLAQDQIVAFYLAQEGVEVVRNMRDENRLSGDDQLDNSLASCVVDPDNAADVGCTVDATNVTSFSFAVVDCTSSCPAIRKDDDFFTHRTSGAYVPTKYVREVRVWYVEDPSDVGSRKEAVVEVKVTWPFLNTSRTYTLRDNLLEW